MKGQQAQKRIASIHSISLPFCFQFLYFSLAFILMSARSFSFSTCRQIRAESAGAPKTFRWHLCVRNTIVNIFAHKMHEFMRTIPIWIGCLARTVSLSWHKCNSKTSEYMRFAVAICVRSIHSLYKPKQFQVLFFLLLVVVWNAASFSLVRLTSFPNFARGFSFYFARSHSAGAQHTRVLMQRIRCRATGEKSKVWMGARCCRCEDGNFLLSHKFNCS